VLTICDGQLAVPASNCTLCGYVLEYFSGISVSLSQQMFVYSLISTINVSACTVLTLCDGQLAVPANNCILCAGLFFSIICLFITANVCYIALYLLLI